MISIFHIYFLKFKRYFDNFFLKMYFQMYFQTFFNRKKKNKFPSNFLIINKIIINKKVFLPLF